MNDAISQISAISGLERRYKDLKIVIRPLISYKLSFFQDKYAKESSGPEVIKLFSCLTQLSMKFFLLINVKMPTIVGILTFMSGKNSILVLSEHKRSQLS